MVILKKKNLDPQLHQIFKPIRKFFCTFLLPSCFKLRHHLNHIKFHKNTRPKICFIIIHFIHS